jgi:hypothetical protein
MSAARFRIDCPGRSSDPTRGECSASVAAGCRRPTWVGPIYPCSGHHRGSRHPLCFSSPIVRPRSSLLCSTLATASPAVAHRRRATRELSDRAKRSAPSPRPSCTKSMPGAPASEAGQRDCPTVVFLRELQMTWTLIRRSKIVSLMDWWMDLPMLWKPETLRTFRLW